MDEDLKFLPVGIKLFFLLCPFWVYPWWMFGKVLSSSYVGTHKQNIGTKNVLLIVANVLFFYIFVYLYYPMKFERKFLKGPPPGPPLFWKIRPPPAEKKIGPPPLGFWSSPTYAPHPLDSHHGIDVYFDSRFLCGFPATRAEKTWNNSSTLVKHHNTSLVWKCSIYLQTLKGGLFFPMVWMRYCVFILTPQQGKGQGLALS